MKENYKIDCPPDPEDPDNPDKTDPNCHKYDFENAFVAMGKGWVALLVFISILLVLYLIIVVIATCVNCFKKPSDDSKVNYTPFPDYYYN